MFPPTLSVSFITTEPDTFNASPNVEAPPRLNSPVIVELVPTLSVDDIVAVVN